MSHSSMNHIDKPRRHDAGACKSLTPQRKHRKLLKDGSGEEVWPEAIERIFVEGLRQYWQSPWATYSRGRSRWRNQFLVDYLQRAGITRSKKQVASHIQVLRNMWKGEPEFHLVAGGEELFLESGLLAPVKQEERFDPSTLIPLDGEDSDGVSSNTTSPTYSPLDFKCEFPPSPAQTLGPTLHSSPIFSSETNLSPPPTGNYPQVELLQNESTVYSASSPPAALQTMVDPARVSPKCSISIPSPPVPLNIYAPAIVASTPSTSYMVYPQLDAPSSPSTNFSNNYSYAQPTNPNRVEKFYLLAEGMQPFSVRVDSYTSPQSPSCSYPVAIQTKLRIPPIDDIHSPATLHGFIGSVSLTFPWTTSARCITKVYEGNTCTLTETGLLQPSPTGPTTAFLPDSNFSRCRWLNATVPTVITQQIIVDNEILLYAVHSLDRKSGGPMPSAELVNCQPYRPNTNTVVRQSSIPISYSQQQSYSTTPQPQQYLSQTLRTSQTSLSCALTPMASIRPPMMTTSMLF